MLDARQVRRPPEPLSALSVEALGSRTRTALAWALGRSSDLDPRIQVLAATYSDRAEVAEAEATGSVLLEVTAE